VFFGGLLHGLGYWLTSLMPSIECVFITHSILAGTGGGFVYSPSIIIVSQYFSRKRSLALGISTAGSGLGMLALAPLVEYFFNEFGFEGGFWMVGAIALHPCIAATLYRPLPSTSKLGHRKERRSVSAPKCCGIADVLRNSVLFNKPFAVYLVAVVLGNFAFQLPVMIMVDHLRNQSMGEALPVLLISLIGLTDTVGRPVSGLLFMKLNLFNRRVAYTPQATAC
jgi:MFS family permease